MNEHLHIAQKCTGCAHLLDAGWREPRCADACPTGALKFLEEAEAAESRGRRGVALPEEGLEPRVYYRNIPKKFIAGTVYDPVKKEVIRGAACTLGRARTTRPDGQDRRLRGLLVRGLDAGTYSLEIAMDGFPARSFAGLTTERDSQSGRHPSRLKREGTEKRDGNS